MGTIAIVVILVIIVAVAGGSTYKKATKGGGCCGEHESAPKRIKVNDHDKSHYPYEAELVIDGMTCGNCARRVENALNALDGTWAEVDLGEKKAKVHLKNKPDINAMAKAVADEGYTVLKNRSKF